MLLVRFIEILRLATLVSVHGQTVETAFVPMLAERHGDRVTLFGHIDAANPKAEQAQSVPIPCSR